MSSIDSDSENEATRSNLSVADTIPYFSSDSDSEADSERNSISGTSYSSMSAASEDNLAIEEENDSDLTSDTEEYDIPDMIPQAVPNPQDPVVEINDTQELIEDDDVILIPQEIETIDLCTQAIIPVNLPAHLQNQVIDITESPTQAPIQVQPQPRRVSFRLSAARDSSSQNDAGPSRQRRNNNRFSPIAPNNAGPSTSKQAPKTSTPTRSLNFDDTLDLSQSTIKLSCPICLESVKGRNPVSTMCGHIFCKNCIVLSMRSAKKCPMCKRNLPNKNPFIDIFF